MTASGDLSQRRHERREIDYWSRSRGKAAEVDSLDGLTQKMAEARVVLEKLERFDAYFREATVIAELGGGECWFSCIVKRQFGPHNTVIGSDIATDALAAAPEWERIFQVRLEGTSVCRSYEMPLRSESVDLVVAFASAHHFGAHRRTLEEISRVLAPRGRALYLHEPGCRRYIHRLARRRVQTKRSIVGEDVLVYRDLVALAERAGLSAEVVFSPTTTFRGPLQTVYYLVLKRIPALQHVLPCSVDLVFSKP